MSIGYAWEKCAKAMDGMATSSKSLQHRIGDAFVYNLIHIKPEEYLPSDSRALFREIYERMTKVKAKGNEGNVMATISVMSTTEAEEIARLISRLSDEVNVAYDESRTR